MKIYAPVKDFNGFRNNVRFVRGVGETDNPETINWFKDHGYIVEESVDIVEVAVAPIEPLVEKCDETIVETIEKCDEPDFDSMTPNELREWMKENGYGLKMKNIRSKDKLIEIIRG